MRTPKKRGRAGYMISAVAELYNLHPQTLRLYERVGLLKPSRSEGNTRLYTEGDLERLEVILTLTREMGVNLAGIEIILNMREKISEMQRQMQAFTEFIQHELSRGLHSVQHKSSRDALGACSASASDPRTQVASRKFRFRVAFSHFQSFSTPTFTCAPPHAMPDMLWNRG